MLRESYSELILLAFQKAIDIQDFLPFADVVRNETNILIFEFEIACKSQFVQVLS